MSVATKRAVKPNTSKLAAKDMPAARHSSTGKGTRRKPMNLEEALREEGIDERKIARGYAGVHDKLGDSVDKGDLKLFVDVLKENTRILVDASRSGDRNGAGDGPVTIILKHNVPRPAR